METLNKKEQILKSFKEGKTVQSKNGNEWKDFIRQNQLDVPNLDYGGIDNWRIKPEPIMQQPLFMNWDNRYPDTNMTEPFAQSLKQLEKMEAEKKELLEALNLAKKEMKQCLNFLSVEGYEYLEFESLQEIESLTQKHKQ